MPASVVGRLTTKTSPPSRKQAQALASPTPWIHPESRHCPPLPRQIAPQGTRGWRPRVLCLPYRSHKLPLYTVELVTESILLSPIDHGSSWDGSRPAINSLRTGYRTYAAWHALDRAVKSRVFLARPFPHSGDRWMSTQLLLLDPTECVPRKLAPTIRPGSQEECRELLCDWSPSPVGGVLQSPQGIIVQLQAFSYPANVTPVTGIYRSLYFY
ncbi:uncharacterized protein B0T23DRAFT_172104 [Neurospora hispaniola]|uniref:Uncharacterized protein n=1 Tax=Neurospora hispaniola TaxID=588809 RepID=A0AAJ0I6H0_9PEZI|nr:hypothetical protein B0T23DRAFT_172104 [Neurospora hispaniola]